jgi:hypothetical protein
MRRRVLASVVILSLLAASMVWAVTKQFVSPGAGIIFADSGGTVTWTLSNRTNNTGQVSARYDKNALATPSGAMPAIWEIRCRLSFTGTNVLGSTAEFYVATSDGTNPDAEVGTTDTAITSDQRRALTLFLGVLPVYQTASNTTMTVSFRNVSIPTRYFSMVMWNNTGLPTETSTTKHRCTATPMRVEQQNQE